MSVTAPPRVGARPHLPRPDPPSFGGESNDWSLLVVAGNRVIAHLIGGLLSEEGIEFVLDTSNPSPAAWLHPFGDLGAPVKVMVRRLDLPHARALIDPVRTGTTPDRGRQDELPIRATWSPRLAFALVVAVALLLAFVEVVGFAPCFLRLFCF